MSGFRPPRSASLIAAGVAALLAAASAGCAASDPSPAAPAAEVPEELSVFAAASLEPAFEQLEERFTAEHPGVSIEFTYDGSSVLSTQIVSGAPADLFASADAANMERVVEAGLAEGEPVAFATSELAIAVAPGNPLGIERLSDLVRGTGGTKPVVVVCAVEVPCGSASRALLERDGVALEPASEEQNVTAVLAKVRRGEADAGLVYRSDILRAEGEIEGIEIPRADEAAGDYLAVPLAGGDASLAAAFADLLRTEHARRLFAELGFGPAR